MSATDYERGILDGWCKAVARVRELHEVSVSTPMDIGPEPSGAKSLVVALAAVYLKGFNQALAQTAKTLEEETPP